MSPKTIAAWFMFSLIAAFVAGALVFFMASLRARFPVDQEPDPESFSGENTKCSSSKCSLQLSTSSPPSGSSSSATGCSSSTEGVKVFQLCKTAFTYRDIVAATRNFSDDLVIGRGGYGVVYRGELPDGRTVAVKKLARPRDGDCEREFRAEMEVLYPRLVPGGILILDDYGYWQGARKAVDDYFATQPALLVRLDNSARLVVKPV